MQPICSQTDYAIRGYTLGLPARSHLCSMHPMLPARCLPQIARIDSSVGQALSQLDTLLLPRNNIASLADIAALKGCSKLTHLNLLHNPVTRRAHYRLFTVYTLPQLVMLDCQKICQSERQAADTLFASEEGRLLLAAMQKAQHVSLAAPALGITGTAVASSSASAETPAALPAAGPAGAAARPAFTPAQLNAIRTAIQSASTPDEIDRLEKFLKLGKLPPELRAAEQRTAAAADAE